VFAFSGVLNRLPGEKRDPAFLEYAVSLAAGDEKKRVCFIPAATGDSPSAIEAVTEVFAGRKDVDFSVLTLFTQPGVPDVQAHLTAQDVLLVGGGSVVNLMAVWRAHGLASVMRECWEALAWSQPQVYLSTARLRRRRLRAGFRLPGYKGDLLFTQVL
jgi:peptidase E